MTEEHFTKADFRVIFDVPSRNDLVHCDLWCMYIDPDELDELELWGIPRAVLEAELVKPLATCNDHPVYPIPRGKQFKPREFIYLGVKVECVEFGDRAFDGFATFVDGDLRAISLLVDSSDPLTFYLYPLEFEGNINSYQVIVSNKSSVTRVTFRLQADRNIPWAVLPLEVEIPLIEM
jgi:hypothetical protein